MIDIKALNDRLVEQDEELRGRFSEILLTYEDDNPAMRAMIALLAEGLAAIHERQGNLITLMLQSGR